LGKLNLENNGKSFKVVSEIVGSEQVDEEIACGEGKEAK